MNDLACQTRLSHTYRAIQFGHQNPALFRMFARKAGLRRIGDILDEAAQLGRTKTPDISPVNPYRLVMRPGSYTWHWGDIGLQDCRRARRRIFTRAAIVLGNPDQAMLWLKTEKLSLSWQRPIDVIDSDSGRYRVLALLAALYT